VAFAGKLTAIAAVMGALLWLPRHLSVLFTRPAQEEIEAAKMLIEGLDAKVKDANRKRTQTQQETSAMRREFERLSAVTNEQKKQLEAADFAVLQAQTKLNEAKVELQEVARLKESFRKF
jgi:chromosome segregation ATPase